MLSQGIFQFCHYAHKRSPFLGRGFVLCTFRFSIDSSFLCSFNNSMATPAAKDCLCWASRFLILATSSCISFSASRFYLAPILTNSLLVTHLWAAHMVCGESSSEAFSMKYDFIASDICVWSRASVSRDGFSLHMLFFGCSVGDHKYKEKGTWSERDLMPILADCNSGRSLCDRKM